MDSNDRITPYSINSAAKIEYQILSQGHWYDALRVAENIICEKRDAIEYARIARDEREQKIRHQETYLSDYSDLEQIEIVSDIRRWSVDLKKQDRLIEDADFELKVATRLKQNILSAHPEIATMDYAQIQNVGSYEAYIDSRAKALAVSFVCTQYNLPAAAVEFLLGGDPECISQVNQLVGPYTKKIEQKLKDLSTLLENRHLSHAELSAN